MFTARSGRPALALILGALLLTGCAPSSTFTLQQPFAPASQRHLRLESSAAVCAVEGDDQVAALTFALPGAVDGPRAFVVYVAAPPGTHARPVVPQDAAAARGFIIQEVGRLAGRSDFASGTVRFREPLFAPRTRRLDLDVQTADGARLVGTATLEYDARRVATLRREFAADIATLLPPPAEVEEGAEPAADATQVVSDRQTGPAGGPAPHQ